MRLLFFIACTFGYAAPAITAVYNVGSWLPPALPNSGIAQGSIFAVIGTGLGPATLQEAPGYPLPTTQGLAGTTVTVTVGTQAEPCVLIFTASTVVAAVLPSATPVGNGTIAVSYQGTTTSSIIQIVPASFGISTLNDGGTGPAVITDLSYNPITMINPAHPGDSLILWGTGLGAVSGDETQPPQPVNFPGVQVLIENQPAAVSYAGRSGAPGLDQINLTVPTGISGGCKASILVVVNGVTSNVPTMSIAPAGQATCGDTYGALTAANLTKAVTDGSLNLASVNITRVGATGDDDLLANFSNYPINTLIRSYGGSIGSSIGSCITYELLGSTLVITDPMFNYPGLQPAPLDTGSSLMISPAGKSTTTVQASSTGSYLAVLGTSGHTYIDPGTYSVANGNGGAQVGPFNWSDTLPAAIAFTKVPTTITRAQDLTVTWTNSSAYSLVSIFGFAGVPVTSTTNSYVEFICAADASTTQFTIPSAILSLLPTNGYGAEGVPGMAIEIAGVVVNRFSVAGSPGVDAGIFSMFTSAGGIAKVQ